MEERPVIRSSRLLLSPMRHIDAQAIFDLRQSYDVYKWSTTGKWPDLKFAQDWVAVKAERPVPCDFTIREIPTERQHDDPIDSTIIGSIGCPKIGIVGYLLDPSVWGKGYATEALVAFLKAMFGLFAPEIEEWIAQTDPENAASERVLEKVGFVRKGDVATWENPIMGTRGSQDWVLPKDVFYARHGDAR